MNTSTLPPVNRPLRVDADVDVDETVHSHSICWGAVFAGAAGAASLSLILLVLGVGLGLSSVSPWSSQGVSAETFGVSTIAWITFTQLAASGLGGYLAGRLRHRWGRVHTDELYFRDTAHGFLAWSIAMLATAGMLTAAIGTIVGGGAKAGATAVVAAPATATAASASGLSPDYFVDTLFRRVGEGAATAASAPASSPDGGTFAPDSAAVVPSGSETAVAAPVRQEAPPTAEAVRIFANAASANALPVEDARYLGQLVAQRTGLGQQEAERRVTEAFSRLQAKAMAAREQAKEVTDKARSASAKAALWGFISLLIGAFVASFMGTLGGRHRDQF